MICVDKNIFVIIASIENKRTVPASVKVFYMEMMLLINCIAFVEPTTESYPAISGPAIAVTTNIHERIIGILLQKAVKNV